MHRVTYIHRLIGSGIGRRLVFIAGKDNMNRMILSHIGKRMGRNRSNRDAIHPNILNMIIRTRTDGERSVGTMVNRYIACGRNASISPGSCSNRVRIYSKTRLDRMILGHTGKRIGSNRSNRNPIHQNILNMIIRTRTDGKCSAGSLVDCYIA